MKKIIFAFVALMMLSACGKATVTTDKTVDSVATDTVTEVTDTL